jgi:hypothetical protein
MGRGNRRVGRLGETLGTYDKLTELLVYVRGFDHSRRCSPSMQSVSTAVPCGCAQESWLID